jgi:TM2 domain-containing membrane protein YozV
MVKMTKKICPECGNEQDNLGNYCKNCGALLLDENESSQNIGSDAKVCPECGAEQINQAKFCKNCGASLENETRNDNDWLKCAHCGCELNAEQFCPDCGKPTGIKVCPKCMKKSVNENYCPTCGYRLNPNVKTCQSCGSAMDVNAQVCASCGAAVVQKNPILALVLSLLFPGLGQLYNGQNRKGITLIIAYVVFLILSLILIGIILAILIWLYGMYDAFTSAKALNNGETVEDRIF